MRGYNRQKQDLQSFASPAKSREQLAKHIADDFPGPVSYETHRFVQGKVGLHMIAVEPPVHLRRQKVKP